MASAESLEKKAKRDLHKEFHELMVLKRLIGKAMQSDNKKKAIKRIERKLLREEVIEKHFDDSFVKLEQALIELKGSNTQHYQRLMDLVQKAEIFRKNLLAILSDGGDLDKQIQALKQAPSDVQFKKIEAELLETIKMDEGLTVLLNQIIDETKELTKDIPDQEVNKKLLDTFLDYYDTMGRMKITLDDDSIAVIRKAMDGYRAGAASEEDIAAANKIMGNAIRSVKRQQGREVMMGKAVNDEGGMHSSVLKRVVIVLDDKADIIYMKTGKDNHMNLATPKYWSSPNRHSFWFEYSGGNLILHPAASEDRDRLGRWMDLFKSTGLKGLIKKNLRYFS